jgi:glycosyltransferase involved in cell wall biosynthesis
MAMFRFEHSNLQDEYDYFIFSGNWAHHASKHHSPSIFYCNTPVRAVYDLYPSFSQSLPFYSRPAYAAWACAIKWKDQRSVKRVTKVVANSKNVQERIYRYHNRESEVIYPAIDTSLYRCEEYGDFWLSVNRLYPEKRIYLQIEAFSRHPEENLVIVGGCAPGDHASSYARYIYSLAAKYPNINILGQVPHEEVQSLYARCKGLICTAVNEDFGMTPLEAMASGKPVIAVCEGGFLETVTPSCGVLIAADQRSIFEAVQKVGVNPEQFHDACISRAAEFDISVFKKKILVAVDEITRDAV